MINIPKFLRSFQFAARGIVDLFRFENNAKIHLLAAILVIGAGFWLHLSTTEWVLIITQIGLVMATESVNTALEKLADRVTTQHDPLIGAAKDLSSGAVLIVAVVALLVGLLIFAPKLLALISL
ncbi:diacylglycerol kinase family protein [Fibrella forsythiae]|uniref:Diacylglycerol kinase family protein n=1 Tax=Fibrella forsythiae TaxID=2817061 RepID=A0ABS3JSH7_9BACT|nr:diacylglycerol kinase family protein [Fibrella forsythiae]MBO0952336.1 diacylglycerol kinase family protein [Fibrella forsythiae]